MARRNSSDESDDSDQAGSKGNSKAVEIVHEVEEAEQSEGIRTTTLPSKKDRREAARSTNPDKKIKGKKVSPSTDCVACAHLILGKLESQSLTDTTRLGIIVRLRFLRF